MSGALQIQDLQTHEAQHLAMALRNVAVTC